MPSPALQFQVHKKVLANGLTILTRPVTHIPRVEAHIWYRVGSKDEAENERGMAHLIEHMLFKGTDRLSESDINLASQKLTADANAFTSQDYTCYTFRLPSNSWQIALDIFADCMTNARFDKDMLSSELKAVIEEMRMYHDDFQGALIEQMIAGLFPEHPYHYPIIGSKHDLCALTRDKLYQFYQKHYHPNNAVLVVVGDVQPEEVFATAEKFFGKIPAGKLIQPPARYFSDEIYSRSTTLYRPVASPWYGYMFKVPGFSEGKNHLLDIASIVLATGKSSRLYKRLVNKDQLALEIDCSVYDLFERGLLCLGVWPTEGASAEMIEEAIAEELEQLMTLDVQAWEFESAQKRTHVDLTSLLESTEKQAFVAGNAYLATQDEHFIDNYLTAIDSCTADDLQQFFAQFFAITTMHKGYLLPISEADARRLLINHTTADAIEQQILTIHERSTPVEPARWATNLSYKPEQTIAPKPKSFMLKNGLEVLYHHNALVPQIVSVLCFKGSYLYETDAHAGAFSMLMRTITDSTTELSPDAFAQLLEHRAIHLAAGTDNIALKCLTEDFTDGFKLMVDIVKKPSLRPASIEKVRSQMINELEELWESPTDYVDQLAKEIIYERHPYHKNSSGDRDTVTALSRPILQQYARTYLVPDGAVLVVVGDLSGLNLERFVAEHLEDWKGALVPELEYPALPHYEPKVVDLPQQREQTVLAFAAPSIARSHPDYNALSLLDIVLTGGAAGSPASRLFQLREESGLFYMIGGSLLYGSHKEPGMRFIKTIVAPEKALHAQSLILDTLETVGRAGITHDELEDAKNVHFAASVELFETNAQTAQTFLFLKKLNLNFNLFDKQGEILSILKLDQVNRIAREYCRKEAMTLISIGRKSSEKMSVKKGKIR